MNACKLKKQLILHLPYLLAGLLLANLGEAWRMAEGADISEKIRSLIFVMPMAFSNLLPGFHLLDLMVGGCCGGALRLAVYLKGKNAKKYRHGTEYGSAHWSA